MRRNGDLKSAVFVDRDGVVNQAIVVDRLPYAPRKISELKLLDGVVVGVKILKDLGFELVVVTNQPDLASGLVTRQFIEEVHDRISSETDLHHFYVCAHDDKDQCVCRKPKVGLLRKAALELGLSLESSYLVGDRWKDVEAGQRAGCKCFFIDNKYAERRPQPPFTEVSSLLDAALKIRGNETDTRF